MDDIKKLSLTAVLACLIIGCNSSPPELSSNKKLVVIPLEGQAQKKKDNCDSIIPEQTFSLEEVTQQKLEAIRALDLAHKELEKESVILPEHMPSEQILQRGSDRKMPIQEDDGENEDPFLSTITILSRPLQEQF